MKTGISFSSINLFHDLHEKMSEKSKFLFDYLIEGLYLANLIDKFDKNVLSK